MEAPNTACGDTAMVRYATPLLSVENMPELQASKEAFLTNLLNTERLLMRDPQRAAA